MPIKQVAAPIVGETHKSLEKLFVVIRADAAGITNSAEISSVPITRIVTKIVSEIIANNTASTSETRTLLT